MSHPNKRAISRRSKDFNYCRAGLDLGYTAFWRIRQTNASKFIWTHLGTVFQYFRLLSWLLAFDFHGSMKCKSTKLTCMASPSDRRLFTTARPKSSLFQILLRICFEIARYQALCLFKAWSLIQIPIMQSIICDNCKRNEKISSASPTIRDSHHTWVQNDDVEINKEIITFHAICSFQVYACKGKYATQRSYHSHRRHMNSEGTPCEESSS